MPWAQRPELVPYTYLLMILLYSFFRLVESKAEFKFVRAPSSVCRNCIPVVSGSRAGVKVSSPLIINLSSPSDHSPHSP